MNADTRLRVLTDQLIAAGLPVVTVRAADPPSDSTLGFDFTRPLTVAEQQTLAQIRQSFDWTPKRVRAEPALRTLVTNLSAQERNRLLLFVLAQYLRDHPDVADRFGLDVREPA